MPKQVQGWQTSDGRVFLLREHAEAYDAFLNTRTLYEDGADTILWGSDGRVEWRDLVDWLRKHQAIINPILTLPIDPWEPETF